MLSREHINNILEDRTNHHIFNEHHDMEQSKLQRIESYINDQLPYTQRYLSPNHNSVIELIDSSSSGSYKANKRAGNHHNNEDESDSLLSHSISQIVAKKARRKDNSAYRTSQKQRLYKAHHDHHTEPQESRYSSTHSHEIQSHKSDRRSIKKRTSVPSKTNGLHLLKVFVAIL